MRNLIGNAFKFTETGKVVLRISNREDRRLSFQIEDTGIGVPEAADETALSARAVP